MSELFDDSASSCAIDCLSILCKKVDQGLDFSSPSNDEEILHIYDSIIAGEASRSDLEGASTLLSLWLVALKIINIVKLPDDGDYSSMPVHITRFYGAFLSTFEIIFEANPNHSDNLLVGLEASILPPNTIAEDFIVQLLKEYKDWFPYSYMFNRRVGKYPKSSFDIVNRYYKTKVHNRDNSNPHPQTILDISDEDTYKDEADDDTLGDSLTQDSFPNLLPPNVAPIKPFSDAGFNLNPPFHDNSHDSTNNHYQADSDPSDPSSLTPNEASILNSYYLNWKTPVEEDEDSDDNQYFQNLKPKRVTRMKASARKGKKMTRRKLDDVSSYTSDDFENKLPPGVPKAGSKSVSFADDSQSQINPSEDIVEEFVDLTEESPDRNSSVFNYNRNDTTTKKGIPDDDVLKDSSYNSESSLDLSDQEKQLKGKRNNLISIDNEEIVSREKNIQTSSNSTIKMSDSPVIKQRFVFSDDEKDLKQSKPNYSIDRVTSDSVTIPTTKGIDTWVSKGSNRYRNPLDWSIESTSPFPGEDKFVPSSMKKSPLSSTESLSESQETMPKPTLNPRSPTRDFEFDKPSQPNLAKNNSKPLPKSLLNQSYDSSNSSTYTAKYISDNKFEKLKQRIKRRKEQQNHSFEKVKANHFPDPHPTIKVNSVDPQLNQDQPRVFKNELGHQRKPLEVSSPLDSRELLPKNQSRIQAANSKSLRFSQEFQKSDVDKLPSSTVPSLSEYNRYKYFSDPMNLRGSNSLEHGLKTSSIPVSNSYSSNSPDNKLPELKRIVSLDLRQKPSAQPVKEFVSLSIQSSLPPDHIRIVCPSPTIPDIVELRESQDFLEESKTEIPPMSDLVNALSLQIDSVLGSSFKDLPNNLQLPSPSEIAISSGLILEGFVLKKSSILGIWKKKYFVLRESTECFCKLEIYNKAVESSWGFIPLNLKTVIPIQDIASIESVGSKGTQGKEFVINFHAKKDKASSFSIPFFKTKKSPLSQSALQFQNQNDNQIVENDANSDAGSLASEGFYGTKIKQIQIQCNQAEERLLWVTIFNKVLLLAEAVQSLK